MYSLIMIVCDDILFYGNKSVQSFISQLFDTHVCLFGESF